MGQPLPLPERIPVPSQKTLTAMTACGIQLDQESQSVYREYTLPTGWKMVDNSWRQDLPEYYIVDELGLTRFCISGSWKGSYDNELRISTVHEPKLLKRREEELIPSETSNAAMIGKFAEALDPVLLQTCRVTCPSCG